MFYYSITDFGFETCVNVDDVRAVYVRPLLKRFINQDDLDSLQVFHKSKGSWLGREYQRAWWRHVFLLRISARALFCLAAMSRANKTLWKIDNPPEFFFGAEVMSDSFRTNARSMITVETDQWIMERLRQKYSENKLIQSVKYLCVFKNKFGTMCLQYLSYFCIYVCIENIFEHCSPAFKNKIFNPKKR